MSTSLDLIGSLTRVVALLSHIVVALLPISVGVAYLVAWFDVPPAVAWIRNLQRQADRVVSEATFQRISAALESPLAQASSEQDLNDSVTLASSDSPPCYVLRIPDNASGSVVVDWPLLQAAAIVNIPAPVVEPDPLVLVRLLHLWQTGRHVDAHHSLFCASLMMHDIMFGIGLSRPHLRLCQARDRAKTLDSVVYQADLALRRCVGQIIAQFPESSSRADKAITAQGANQLRQQVLKLVRANTSIDATHEFQTAWAAQSSGSNGSCSSTSSLSAPI
jgi:hypothetical protein